MISSLALHVGHGVLRLRYARLATSAPLRMTPVGEGADPPKSLRRAGTISFNRSTYLNGDQNSAGATSESAANVKSETFGPVSTEYGP